MAPTPSTASTYSEQLPGDSFHRPGSTVAAVAVPGDPALVSPASIVATEHSSAGVFVLPVILWLLLLLVVVLLLCCAAVRAPRRQTGSHSAAAARPGSPGGAGQVRKAACSACCGEAAARPHSEWPLRSRRLGAGRLRPLELLLQPVGAHEVPGAGQQEGGGEPEVGVVQLEDGQAVERQGDALEQALAQPRGDQDQDGQAEEDVGELVVDGGAQAVGLGVVDRKPS